MWPQAADFPEQQNSEYSGARITWIYLNSALSSNQVKRYSYFMYSKPSEEEEEFRKIPELLAPQDSSFCPLKEIIAQKSHYIKDGSVV